MEKVKPLLIWVGGSDTPFVFDGNGVDFEAIVKAMESMSTFTLMKNDGSVIAFNPHRVDAVQIGEK